LEPALTPLYCVRPSAVRITGGMPLEKMRRNRAYLMSLDSDNLLLPYEFEAGLYSLRGKKTDFHWGWDSPLSFLRGSSPATGLAPPRCCSGRTGTTRS